MSGEAAPPPPKPPKPSTPPPPPPNPPAPPRKRSSALPPMVFEPATAAAAADAPTAAAVVPPFAALAAGPRTRFRPSFFADSLFAAQSAVVAGPFVDDRWVRAFEFKALVIAAEFPDAAPEHPIRRVDAPKAAATAGIFARGLAAGSEGRAGGGTSESTAFFPGRVFPDPAAATARPSIVSDEPLRATPPLATFPANVTRCRRSDPWSKIAPPMPAPPPPALNASPPLARPFERVRSRSVNSPFGIPEIPPET